MATITHSLSISSSSFSSISLNNYTQKQQNPISLNTVSMGSSLRRKRQHHQQRIIISCEVALKSDSAPSISSSSEVPETKENEDQAKVGARVRVKVPLKVYHVPKVPEVDITGMEGKIKQFVGLWKGKHISANLPFKIEFVKEIEGRGPVKFVAHLKEDEFEYLD